MSKVVCFASNLKWIKKHFSVTFLVVTPLGYFHSQNSNYNLEMCTQFNFFNILFEAL